MTVIDEYLKRIEPSKRKELERIREIAKKVVPDAEETINYGMPTLKYKGKAFLGFDAHKEHLGIYPYGGAEIEALKGKLSSYGLSKGAIRVSYNKPMAESLLKEIILLRIKRIV